MSRGNLMFVLHAHLPFVRHPEHERSIEENWLFEAISETYLPLLRVFEGFEKDNIPFSMAMSLSPTLVSMLGDQFLQERYVKHLELLIELAGKEIARTANSDPEALALARMYKELYEQNLHDFSHKFKLDIRRGFKHYQDIGCLELFTTAATHSYFPLLEQSPESVRAQISVAYENHVKVFKQPPAGFWLPECGYFEGFESYLKEYKFKYFFVDAHGIAYGSQKPRFGTFAPVRTPSGPFVFGRDLESSNAVWSAEEGYPADYSYREFYRDIGFDLPLEQLAPFINNGDIRINTGIKYHAITGQTDQKRLYNIDEAREKAEEHAENFLYKRLKQINKASQYMDDSAPVIVCPYDAELFGHWWFEGPVWIDGVVRKLNDRYSDIQTITPSAYIESSPECQTSQPAFSSWGNKGYSEVWLNDSNDWIYRHLYKALKRMKELTQRYPKESGLNKRSLDQAARELLLSQSSDWPFIMKTGTTVRYAVKRFKEHIYNFTFIYESLRQGKISTEWLTILEQKNNIFPNIDYRIFGENNNSSIV